MTAWGYQGIVPGPMIVAYVGDTLVVHLINNLPEPTVIHWHGAAGARVHGRHPICAAPRRRAPRSSTGPRSPDAGTFWYHRTPTRRCRSNAACTAR
ncbi:MAG: multicopper oxidase domain-containing protein [Myxococcales bacterium]|nr:multicopper oxidase domain-containing protein [Myxococcales bacterium]